MNHVGGNIPSVTVLVLIGKQYPLTGENKVSHALSPKELDSQSEIKIHRWVELGSEELRALDDYPELTKKILRMGFEDAPDSPAFLCYDTSGRVWSAKPNDNGKYYPFHFEVGSRCYGYRNSKVAAN